MPLSVQTFGSVAEANAALKMPGTRYVGGGTLAVRAASEGDLAIGTFVLSTDDALRRVVVADGEVTLGGSVTMAEVTRSDELSDIARAARAVGGPAIRNMATVGGNLFAPAPYGDFAAALLALDAAVLLLDREVPVEEFLARREAEQGIVTAVRFRLPETNTFRFVKVSRVRPKGVSVSAIAAVIELDSGRAVRSARIALNGMGERPIRARGAEAALTGSILSAATIAAAAAVVGNGTSPLTDPVASAWYRSEVLPVHFRRLLAG